MKKLIAIIVVLGAIGAGGWWYYKYGTPEVKPVITTLALRRGSVAEVVKATGTLDAERSVTIGTQVSGTVKELYVDFNDIVKKGQLLAELDPSILETQVEMQEANLTRAKVDLDQRQVSLENNQKKYERQQELFAKNLVTREQLEAAELSVKMDRAAIASSKASMVQTEANLKQAKVNLSYTKVYAPIDGVITVRQADKGITVNASTSAPTLYMMATDLTTMKLTASIDEAEISKVREGEPVTFTVDAYLPTVFRGTVKQVRLNAKNTQNVVTYETVITVPNADLRLKPGMTANLTIEIQRVDDVVMVPSSALRFRPTAEMFELLKQPVPPEAQPNQGGRGAAGRGRGDAGGAPAPAAATPGATTSAPAATPGAAPKQQAQAGGNRQAGTGGDRQRGGDQAAGGRGGNQGGGRGGGGRNMNLTPEQQKQMDAIAKLPPDQQREARMKLFASMGFGGGRGGNQAGGRGGNQGGGRTGGFTGGGQTGGSGVGMADRGAKTIEELMPPVVRREQRNQRVWMHVDGKLKPISGLTTGISDGQWTELVGGADLLKEGDLVVTNFVIPGQKATLPNQQQGNPFQQQGPGRGPGGGGGGGGRGGF
jgi:HlyD family secretion protein